ncbi:MAG: tRNA (adenosine(37)-N6)-dimethylallyltransferase MiaA [Thermodesulfobacteriota bacterium]|nr:tRNA (adenosine(37)-N6)-dimethylallyltransferase MiaA [Thermodesulfobacteriota bacterium]
MGKTKVLVIVGSTAIGKTQLALELAIEMNAEIISADSMQIYKYMDIGTAKPTLDEQKRVKHHIIDIMYPDESFSAALFKKRARQAVSSINEEGKTAIVAGGTGLYIKAFTNGLFKSPEANASLRQALWEKTIKGGSSYLHRELENVDPATASTVHPNDFFRIIRALEVCYLTKRPISKQREEHRFKDSPFETLKIGIHSDRQQLYSKIEDRIDNMITNGIVDEVESLLDMGYTRDLNSMKGLGYKQIINHLLGDSLLDDAILQMKQDTKRYAKRQMTWFRADPEINWYTLPNDYQTILQKTKEFFEG